MKTIAALVLLLLPSVVGAKAEEPKPYEMPRTQVVPIQDSNADRQYELYIKLPEEYSEKPDERYPVIFMTDAVWHMDMLSGSTEYLMSDVILVGISWDKGVDDEREFVSRFRDYTVVTSETASVPTGEADKHLSFIRDDVIKYVETNYRTDPEEHTYFGYSLGGAFGAYILFERPDTFKNYILGSPALGQRSLTYIDELEEETASRQQEMNANVFVSIGEMEESEMENVEALMSVIQRRNQSGLNITALEIIEDADHGTAFPETVIRAVKWLSQLKNE